jgi:Zn-dependent metalloprotease
MKKLLLFAGLLFSVTLLNAQQNQGVAITEKQNGWFYFDKGLNAAPEDIFVLFAAQLKLGENDRMVTVRTDTDKLGFTHSRFRQHYKGIPVEGTDFIVHSRNGSINSCNGKLLCGLSLSTTPAITAQQAIQTAIAQTNAEKYMWEDEANEAMIKYISGNQNASFYPVAELVIAERHYGSDASAYRLLWKVNVYAEKPISNRSVYIDASSGLYYHSVDILKHTDVPGIAVTKYNGSQTIITDSVAPGQYRLRESGRGSGIETYDMNEGTSYAAAVDFTDSDNYWDNVNAQMDEIATDAHFGAEATFDYYFDIHGRYSYDDNGAKLLSYVHYDQNYANAFWDGMRMTYGDGDAQNGPFTALDVCGHEITHAVSDYTAGFIYQYESGALSEAFSDIFGTCVEFYATPALADWFIGEDFDLSGGNGFRNMEDPKTDQQPDTYQGQYWYTGSLDNGGVHINNSVGNYWFYLLTEGGSGINDKNHSYDVTGIGIDSAAQIAYRAMAYYLTSNSQYSDARMASLQAAADLYGNCSEAYIQTANAWYAVGVGQAIAEYDLSMSRVTSPVTACGLGTETVAGEFVYNGCNQSLNPGDTVYINFSVDGGSTVTEILTLSSTVNGGDTVQFTFAQTADVQQTGWHTLDLWISYAADSMQYNDTLTGYTFENRLYQNSDVGVTAFLSPVSSCHMSSAETVTIAIGFFGCEFLPAGDTIDVSYSINGGAAVTGKAAVPFNFYPGNVLTYTFPTPADLSAPGTYTFTARTDFDIDSLNSNDQSAPYQVKNPQGLQDTTVTFEGANPGIFYVVDLAPYANAYVATAAANSGSRGFLMTGGNAMSYIDLLEFPDGTNTWQINDFLSAKITFCVDATAWSSAHLRFDLKQTYGKDAYEMVLGPGINYSVASNFRILVNNSIQIGPTYNPTTASSDPYLTRYVNLTPYAGTEFTITFETRNISKDTLFFRMDNAYIDNVRIQELDYSDIGEIVSLDAYVNIMPNPVTDRLNISFFSQYDAQAVISIYDLSGRIIYRQSDKANPGYNVYVAETSSYAPGLYFITLESAGGKFRSKFIKQ